MRFPRGLAGLLLAVSAHAETHTYSATLPAAPTSWTATATLPRWDPSNGTLEAITLTITATVEGSIALENTSDQPILSTVSVSAVVALTLPDHSVISPPAPNAVFADLLGPHDGVIDYGGTSGITHAFVATDSASTTSPPPLSDLLLFTGAPGNPGTIDLPVAAFGATTSSSGALVQVTLVARAALELTYTFTPPAVSAFCSGDGTATACPCGNSGGAGRGCASSFDAAGALLTASGNASVSDDTFVLHGEATGGAPVLFFQGTLAENGGFGTPFGDGLRCAGGVTVRLGAAIPNAGVTQYPSPSEPRISVQGGIPPVGAATRHYQAVYRNVAGFCTPATFNLTNALAVPWFP